MVFDSDIGIGFGKYAHPNIADLEALNGLQNVSQIAIGTVTTLFNSRFHWTRWHGQLFHIMGLQVLGLVSGHGCAFPSVGAKAATSVAAELEWCRII